MQVMGKLVYKTHLCFSISQYILYLEHPRLVADTHTAAESTEVRACSNFLFLRGFLW